MTQGFLTMSYLTAGGLFILSLGGLSKHDSAERGNLFGIAGMTLAVVATLLSLTGFQWSAFSIALLISAAMGLIVAARVQMTSMPELVAILHSFVGLAAVFVAGSLYLRGTELVGIEGLIHSLEIYVGAFIGALTFTGSLVAFGKLKGMLSSKPLLLPGRHVYNLGIVGACVVLGTMFMSLDAPAGLLPFMVMCILAGILGYHLVAAIGGADMPVVVSMLNSYSGWAAAASGFSLKNDLLIITGALVGSSGAILSYIMCKAMNRSIVNVIFGGFGAVETKSGQSGEAKPLQELKADQVASTLLESNEVIIVPGYGMAVAQAQHPIRELAELLKKAGVRVRFAIHPVAGRLPGHMNVLLAEANIPYDIVLEMEEINEDFKNCGTVIVVGANDIVNPGALDDKSSPIFGMPVLHCWEAKHVIVLKRSTASGYSGVDNPLFYKPNTWMLFGDAKDSIQKLVREVGVAVK